MKKIIVAGAGHGGITAAFNLVKAGYDVTVYEKANREDLGYDWVDCMRKDDFDETGYIRPDDSNFLPIADQGYFSPKKSVKIVVEKDYGGRIGYIERKFLINYIIDGAEKEGVKFFFNTPVVCTLYDSNRVTGIRIKENGEEKDVLADMVIDAAGMNSPVRSTLPESFGVRRKPFSDETFCTWRGSFKKTKDFTAEPKNTIYFYHCGKSGMDWAINEDDSIDILIGGFGSLSDKEINDALADFRKDYPIEDKVARGGTKDCIPLGRFLSVMVCNSYAAVGNSAFMTEPLSGSGIDMSMRAGKLLADTVIEANGDYSTKNLWKYNYLAYKKLAEKQYNNLIVKSFISVLTPDDVDFFFEKKVLTAKEIGGGGNTKYTFKDIVPKLVLLSKPKVLAGLLKVGKKALLLNKVRSAVPEIYSKEAIAQWEKIYLQMR